MKTDEAGEVIKEIILKLEEPDRSRFVEAICTLVEGRNLDKEIESRRPRLTEGHYKTQEDM
jgi:hypothetical protein